MPHGPYVMAHGIGSRALAPKSPGPWPWPRRFLGQGPGPNPTGHDVWPMGHVLCPMACVLRPMSCVLCPTSYVLCPVSYVLSRVLCPKIMAGSVRRFTVWRVSGPAGSVFQTCQPCQRLPACRLTVSIRRFVVKRPPCSACRMPLYCFAAICSPVARTGMHVHASACLCMFLHAYACICMHMHPCACIRMHFPWDPPRALGQGHKT